MSEMHILAFVFGGIIALGILGFLDWRDDRTEPEGHGCSAHHFPDDGHYSPRSGTETLLDSGESPLHQGHNNVVEEYEELGEPESAKPV